MRAFCLDHPVLTALVLLAVAGLFRLIDIFVLRLDERWGEIIISKLAASALLVGFGAATGVGLAGMGLHGRALWPSVLLGAGLTLLALLVGYAAEFLWQVQEGERPRIALLAIDPKTGLSGAVGFALLLIAGNVVNSFAEEGLFRGVVIPLLLREAAPAAALIVSAILFGLWHLPWAVKAAASQGAGGLALPVGWLVTANFLPQALVGIVWGYLYLRTGNLWGPLVAHTLTNSAINFVHVRTPAGLDLGVTLRMSVFLAVMVLGLLVIHRASQALGLPQVAPWATGNG